MITNPAWRGKRFAVLGLARSGAASVRALVESGAEVTAWDSNEERRAEISGATLADPLDIDLDGFHATGRAHQGNARPHGSGTNDADVLDDHVACSKSVR